MKKYLVLPLLAVALTSCATQELYLNVLFSAMQHLNNISE